MKSGKIIALDDYRTGRHSRAKISGRNRAGIPLPSADRLWELLDRNISFAYWQEHY